jgi:3-methyladenine DNA glycosylase AlkD
MAVREIQKRMRALADQKKARILQGFFKTGPGEYGEGDVFLGIPVPMIRKLAKEHDGTPPDETIKLLTSSFHEERLLALLMLVRDFTRNSEPAKKKIYSLYLRNTRYINSWDLVDLSAPLIVGGYLADKDRKQLYAFARSRDLWKRRIAIMATFAFIRQNDFTDTLNIAEMLLGDRHDLIHKAVGWMLRELGKRDLQAEEAFLLRHHRVMPRTMLRYAIERFPEAKRKRYLKGRRESSPDRVGR